jgi:tRNA-specific 2-thiouridylase
LIFDKIFLLWKMATSTTKTVICAMSGGLDSSVAAALLKRAGFDVIGVFMRFWSDPEEKRIFGVSNRCCSVEAEVRARKVAKVLGIPFYVFDFSKEFKERIVDYFLDSSKKGVTPNPCVVCNKEVKFGLLLEKALSLGADFVATGHYAKVERVKNKESGSEEFKLMRAKDKEKDQSYFLWRLSQWQLSKVLFPISGFMRREVEKLAEKFKLPVVGLKKSVELCFVIYGIEDFLRKYLKENPGKIVDKEGKILGEHKGLWFYTIGQRKGLNLPGGPYWVLEKDLKRNVLIVTKDPQDLLKKELTCKEVNWILSEKPKLPMDVEVKIRYRSELIKATIFPVSQTKNEYKVIFKEPQRAITPGQSVVFFKEEEVVGGGVIC